jgi:hypothetical protein
MTLNLIPSEFPYIGGQFFFFNNIFLAMYCKSCLTVNFGSSQCKPERRHLFNYAVSNKVIGNPDPLFILWMICTPLR